MATEKKDTKVEKKEQKKPKTMDELRKPGLSWPYHEDEEFHLVTPGVHHPEGQTTHE